MAVIKLYGDLKQYGDKFNISADTASEALSAIYYQIDGFKQKIMSGFFRVRINGQDITNDNLQLGLHSRLPPKAVIHIIPKVAGAKGGVFSFIAGAAMAVVGVWTQQYWLVGIGAGMMLGGVAQMLTKIPKTKAGDGSGRNNNTYFSSLDNTIAQGSVVPVCYGLIKVGSKVLSQGLETFNG